MTLLDWLLRHPLVQPLGWALLHFLWQGAVVAGLLALAIRCRTSRGGPLIRSAEGRYLAAGTALLLMAASPLVTLVQSLPASSHAIFAPMSGSSSGPVITDTAVNRHWHTPSLTGTAEPYSIFIIQPLLPSFVAGWLIGVLVQSVRLVGGWAVVQRLRRQATQPIQGEMLARFSDLARRMGISQPVRLLESVVVPVPTVIGWLRAVVLVPMGALAGLPPQQLEALLAHELAHIRRHDYLINLLQTGVETVLFYHPAVWWVSRVIRLERENCCDDMVVDVLGDRVTYARALTSLEALRRVPGPLALAANSSGLLPRVRRILGLPPTSAGLSATGVGGTIVITLILATVLGASTARPAVPTEKTPVSVVVGTGVGTLLVRDSVKADHQRELTEQARVVEARRRAFLVQVKKAETTQVERARAAALRFLESRIARAQAARAAHLAQLQVLMAEIIRTEQGRKALREKVKVEGPHAGQAAASHLRNLNARYRRVRHELILSEQAGKVLHQRAKQLRAQTDMARKDRLAQSPPARAAVDGPHSLQSAQLPVPEAQKTPGRLLAGQTSISTSSGRPGSNLFMAKVGTVRAASTAKTGMSSRKSIVKGAPGRSIQDVTVLDLRGVPPSQVAQIRSIKDVVVVLLDEKNRSALNASMEDVQATVVAGPNARVMVEPFLEFSRAALEAMTARQQFVLVGIAHFKPDVTPALVSEKIAALNVVGVVLASEGVRGALLGRMQITGASVALPDDVTAVAHSVGSNQITPGYLERMADQSVYVNVGSTEIASDVTEKLLAQKIRTYVNIGATIGPKPLLELLKSRSAANLGAFEAVGDKQKGGD